jgi:TonB family protein
MNYTRALFISCLLHGFAFAGSYWFSYGNLGTQLGASLPMQVLFVTTPVEERTYPKPVQKKKLLEKHHEPHTSVAPSQDAPQDFTQPGADLVPNPSNKPIPYPEAARLKGIEGHTLVTLTLDSLGRVIEVSFSSPLHNTLQKAVEETVRTWQFQRTKPSPTHITISVPVAFSLTDGG